MLKKTRVLKKIHHCKSCGSTDLRPLLPGLNSFGFPMDVVQCGACELQFRNIELAPEEVDDLYSDRYFKEEQKDYFFANEKIKERIFSRRLQQVNGASPTKGSLLDVGSAVGTFIKVAKADGWRETGIEVSSYAAGVAKEAGLNSVHGQLADIVAKGQRFDAVTLWDVVDHAERPLDLLKEARQVVADEGVIFVETTVIDSTLFDLSHALHRLSLGLIKGPVLKGYPVHHSNYYSSKTLSQDLERAGFEVIDVLREPFDMSIFSGSALEKFLFGVVEGLSRVFKREIVCTLVARPKAPDTKS